MDALGRQPSRREAGTLFGPDVTKRFLEENHLEMIVRSHEVKMEGYDVQHDISFHPMNSSEFNCCTESALPSSLLPIIVILLAIRVLLFVLIMI